MAVRRGSGKDETFFHKELTVVIVKLITVAVAFGNKVFVVGLSADRSRRDFTIPGSQTHTCSVLSIQHLFLLIRHDMNQGMRCFWIDFGRVSSGKATNIPSEFDTGELHAVAKTQIGHFSFPRVTDSLNDSVDSPPSESARHHHAVKSFQHLRRPFFLYFGRVNPRKNGRTMLAPGRMLNGFKNGDIDIRKHEIAGSKIFANNSYFYRRRIGF